MDENSVAGTSATENKDKIRLKDVFGSTAISYLVGFGLISSLIYFGGVWNILANTRFLDFLIKGGIIKYHDGNQGIVEGVADLEYYLASQDTIDWRLVWVAVGLYFLWYGLKAIQYHGICRFLGMRGTLGQHAKAWIFGNSMGRFLPYQIGHVATAVTLKKQGEDIQLVGKTFGIENALVIFFEIFIFVMYGLIFITWSLWFMQIFWGLVICIVAWLFMRNSSPEPMEVSNIKGFWSNFAYTMRSLMNYPTLLLWLGFLGMLSMLSDDIAPFCMAKAFTSDNVIINIPFLIIQSAVVAGYIAKHIPVAPAGFGQFEWAFAMALYVSGIGFPEAATLAILDSVVRNTVSLVMLGIVTLWYGVEARFPNILGIFARNGNKSLSLEA